MEELKTKNGKICTHDGTHILSIRENIFIDKYIELANATQAAIIAGYTEKSATTTANRMLSKDYINAEIKYRTNERYAANAASAQEVMDFFTKVMRGEIKDQFGLEAPLSERTKAAQEIAKRTVDIENRMAGKKDMQTPEIQIKVDWGRPHTSIQQQDVEDNV